jgi:hypothetical protein
MLFVIGKRRTTDMSPVTGVDDGTTGYGVSGWRNRGGLGVRGISNSSSGMFGYSESL